MARQRFDREKAWTAFLEYVARQREYTDLKAKASPMTPARRKRLAIKLVAADDARHAAYALVDETVEIGIRQVFSKHPDQSMLDDLRQAARLRLYQFLPKMMSFCLNSEHYFRLSLSAVRRASLNEYSRLKRQVKHEVSNEDLGEPGVVPSQIGWAVGVGTLQTTEDADQEYGPLYDVAVDDKRFEEFEERLLSNRSAYNAYDQIKVQLMELYDEEELPAAIALLRAIFLGSDLSDSLMREWKVLNPREMRDAVRAVVRAVSEETE